MECADCRFLKSNKIKSMFVPSMQQTSMPCSMKHLNLNILCKVIISTNHSMILSSLASTQFSGVSLFASFCKGRDTKKADWAEGSHSPTSSTVKNSYYFFLISVIRFIFSFFHPIFIIDSPFAREACEFLTRLQRHTDKLSTSFNGNVYW